MANQRLKGEYVHTCPLCGREGEADFMNLHLKDAHEIRSARKRDELMRYLPRRRLGFRVRERVDA